MRCFACGGPYHPATGHVFLPEVAYCGICAGRFFAWVIRHTSTKSVRPRPGREARTGESFYEAASRGPWAKAA